VLSWYIPNEAAYQILGLLEASLKSTESSIQTDKKILAMNFTSFAGNERSISSDVARRADFNEIPIISLKSPKHELLNQLRDACTRVGFFYIKDHDIAQEKIVNAFKTAEKFFAQDLEVKNEINYKKSKILRGFEPPAEVRTDETRKPDLNEAFNWGYEKELDPLWSGSNLEPGMFTRPGSMTLPAADTSIRMERESNVWGECLAASRWIPRCYI
jgi:hypothetical protein